MRLLLSLVVVIAAATSAACTSVPIQNVSDAPVVSQAGRPLSDEQVRLAIVRAGASLGWVMTEAGPGKLNGKLLLRTHMAEVEIPYSSSRYSIVYKSSIDLQEGNGKIHRNYNGWVQNLARVINAQLVASLKRLGAADDVASHALRLVRTSHAARG